MFGYNFDVNGKTYILRLSTQNIVALEQKLGCNPIAIFGDGTTIPKISDMVLILFYSLQQMNHGLTLNDAYKLFDEYLASGHIATDFISVILEIYKVSGIINDEDTEKNA